MSYPEASGHSVVHQQVYYPGELALGCLDLVTGESYALTGVMETLDALLPDAQRLDNFGAGSRTQVMGCNQDFVVGYTNYISNDGKTLYTVLYAAQGDKLYGGFYEAENELVTFDGALNILHRYSLAEEGIPNIPALIWSAITLPEWGAGAGDAGG